MLPFADAVRPSVSPSQILLETTKGVGLNFELGLAYMNVDDLVMAKAKSKRNS